MSFPPKAGVLPDVCCWLLAPNPHHGTGIPFNSIQAGAHQQTVEIRQRSDNTPSRTLTLLNGCS
jgi:hypothetical protein